MIAGNLHILMVGTKRDSKGFTLVEVLIATFVLAIALLAMAQMQIMAIRGNAFANKTTTSVTLAQDKLEELRGLSYSDSQLAAGDHPNDLAGTDWDYYTREWTVQNDTPTTGLKTVTIDVSWQDASSRQVSLDTITSIISR